MCDQLDTGAAEDVAGVGVAQGEPGPEAGEECAEDLVASGHESGASAARMS